jgi:hypothetical protein
VTPEYNNANSCELALEYITDFIEPWDELGFGGWAVCVRDIGLGTLGNFIIL